MKQNLTSIRMTILILLLCMPLSLMAQKEHFKILGKWCMEGENYELTPYCFEITMNEYGQMTAKVPATYSMRRNVVTSWQKTNVYAFDDGSGYNFEPVNSRQAYCYGVNFKTRSGSNEYKAIRILIDENVGKDRLTASVTCIYGPMEDKIHRLGETNFIKVGDVEKPQLVDNKQTRKIGDEGKVAEAVDLGLSVKWASWNVGASKPEDYGGYYAWGEIEEKDEYDWSTYKYVRNDIDDDYWDDNTNAFVYKYQRIGKQVDDENGIVDISICSSSYDVAHVKWGGNWRMPTKNEISELEEKCKKERSSMNGVEGWYFTGPNGNRIFLPSAGERDGNTTSYDMKDWKGAACMYWSGDLITLYLLLGVQPIMTDGSEAWSMDFDNRGVQFGNFIKRSNGLTVRPVINY